MTARRQAWATCVAAAGNAETARTFKNGCLSKSAAEGLRRGSLMVHCDTKSLKCALKWLPLSSGCSAFGITNSTLMGCRSACGGFCSAISMAVIPAAHCTEPCLAPLASACVPSDNKQGTPGQSPYKVTLRTVATRSIVPLQTLYPTYTPTMAPFRPNGYVQVVRCLELLRHVNAHLETRCLRRLCILPQMTLSPLAPSSRAFQRTSFACIPG